MASFIPGFDVNSLSFLNLRALLQTRPCPHCDKHHALKAHGFLRATDSTIRGIRLDCANRYSNQGCGRTFPVYFEKHIPHASLTCQQVSRLIGSYQETTPDKGIELIGRIAHGICSQSTAYRWIKKFRLNQSTLRSQAYLLTEPEKVEAGSVLSNTWQHLLKAFPTASCILSAFQSKLQINPFRPEDTRWPDCNLSFPAWIDRYWAATGNDNFSPNTPPSTISKALNTS